MVGKVVQHVVVHQCGLPLGSQLLLLKLERLLCDGALRVDKGAFQMILVLLLRIVDQRASGRSDVVFLMLVAGTWDGAAQSTVGGGITSSLILRFQPTVARRSCGNLAVEFLATVLVLLLLKW